MRYKKPGPPPATNLLPRGPKGAVTYGLGKRKKARKPRKLRMGSAQVAVPRLLPKG